MSIISRQVKWLPLLCVLLLATVSCVTTSPEKFHAGIVEADEPENYHFDSTTGSYGANRERSLIMLTINTSIHQQMITPANTNVKPDESNPTVRSYDEFLASLDSQYGLKRVADWPVPPIDVHCLIFELSGNAGIDGTSMLLELAEMPEIDLVQPVQMFGTLQTTYNDPYLPLQHAVRSMRIDQTHQWSKGRGATVAIIDTGLDITNPEFANRIVDSRNYVDSDHQQFLSDVHGTAVGGVIAAASNNKTGMVGIAPQVSIMPMKACWKPGSNANKAQCNSITLLKALDDAIQADVDVINLSLAGPRDPLLEQMIEQAIAQNIIVVGADSKDIEAPFPAIVAGTIAVSDTLRSDTSNSIAAPGRKVLSLHPVDEYQFYDGVSFSTAHVAGIAALVRELATDATAADVLTLMRFTSNFGSGIVNACRAISFIVEADPAVCDAG